MKGCRVIFQGLGDWEVPNLGWKHEIIHLGPRTFFSLFLKLPQVHPQVYISTFKRNYGPFQTFPHVIQTSSSREGDDKRCSYYRV